MRSAAATGGATTASPSARAASPRSGRRARSVTRDQEERMDALKLLKEDHQKVKRLFAEIEDTGPRAARRREELFTELDDALALHEKLEEDVFYPALETHKEAKGIVTEAYEEHHFIDVV